MIIFINRSKQASGGPQWIFRLGSLNSYSTMLLCREVGNLRTKQNEIPDGLVARFLEANEIFPIRYFHTRWEADWRGQSCPPLLLAVAASKFLVTASLLQRFK